MMASDGPGDTGGPIGGGVSIGNYKGVMLCNRPFAGASNAAKAGGAGPTGPGGSFKCGTVEAPWGQGVPISEHQKMVAKMSKKDTVLSKHKKWLVDLQRTKEQLADEYLEEEQAKKDKRDKFMAREAKMRAVVRGSVGSLRRDEEEGEEEEKKDEGRVPGLNLTGKAEPKKGNRLPAWAMTQEKAEQEEEVDELMEADDLMDFVDGLDYNKFEEDMELKVLMDQVKSRISELEGDKELDEAQLQRLIDVELARMRKGEEGEDMGENMMGEEEEEEKSEEKMVRDIMMSAREDGGMKEVHSTKSLEALVKQRKEKVGLESLLPSLVEDSPVDMEAALVDPKVITHLLDGGSAIRDKKTNLSKLPYLNRNPAV